MEVIHFWEPLLTFSQPHAIIYQNVELFYVDPDVWKINEL
jgi:hypothetical protein